MILSFGSEAAAKHDMALRIPRRRVSHGKIYSDEQERLNRAKNKRDTVRRMLKDGMHPPTIAMKTGISMRIVYEVRNAVAKGK